VRDISKYIDQKSYVLFWIIAFIPYCDTIPACYSNIEKKEEICHLLLYVENATEKAYIWRQSKIFTM